MRFLAGKNRFITADPKNLEDQKLVASLEEADKAVADGRFFIRLPKEFNTMDGFWKAPSDVKFEDGKFLDIDNRQTKIGSRDAPAELKLDIQWQFFRFEYFDRWTNSVAVVPQGHPPKDGAGDVAALSLIGQADSFDPPGPPNPPPDARSAWTVGTGKDLVHCLAWVRRGKDPKAATGLRDVADAKSMARFRFDASVFVRTEGDGKSPDAERNLFAFAIGTEPSVANAARLRLYDLPRDWWSTDFPVRFAGEAIDKVQAFQKAVATKSTLAKPYLASLDTIVLDDETGSPLATAKFDDTKLENRIAIFDNQLQVHKPDKGSGGIYFTKVQDLKPPPNGPVLSDLPPFTRLITRATQLFDVFAARTPKKADFKGFPIGARFATRYLDNGTEQTTFRLSEFPHSSPRPNGSAGKNPANVGNSFAALIRCCGHDGDVELFMIFQYMTVNFNFAPPPPLPKDAVALPAPPADATKRSIDCLVKVAQRWNGEDGTHSDKVVFHIGQPEIARGRWKVLLARGNLANPEAAQIKLNIYQKKRAGVFVSTGDFKLTDMSPSSSGRFTAAHEFGHLLGLPDEYFNTDDEPSLDQPHITEARRSPGTPYGFDDAAMMTGGERLVRARYFWHFPLWFRKIRTSTP